MLIWELLKQLGIDLYCAFAKFGRDLVAVIVDSDVRQLRRSVRAGMKYAAEYEKLGAFKHLERTDVVAINVENGEFVVGKSDSDALEAFQAKYGEEVWSYLHHITPLRVGYL